MGTFHTRCQIENPTRRTKRGSLPKVLVDTGSEYTWVPAKILERLDIAREKKDVRFVMANGERITRSVGFAIIRLNEFFTIDEVVFGEPGDLTLLGARTLEGLNLRVDTQQKKLVADGPVPAAGSRVSHRRLRVMHVNACIIGSLNATLPWHWLPAVDLVRTKSWHCSGPVGWARSIRRGTRGSHVRSRSKSFPRLLRQTPSSGSGSTAKPARSRNSRIPTSARCTTSANRRVRLISSWSCSRARRSRSGLPAQGLSLPSKLGAVRACLAKEPDERWQSAKDLHDELAWISAEGVKASGASALLASGVPRASRERVAWLVAAVALVAAALAVPATQYFRRAAPDPVVTRLELNTPPTTDPFSFALSPDGRQIVFVAAAEGGSQLRLRPLDQVTAQPLAGTDGAGAPFWAPDGRAIGFFADARLKRIDPTGGGPQVLADAPVARGGTWNRDRVIVFAPKATSGLMQVAAAGGAAAGLTRTARGQTAHRWPQFLPDGRRFLFFVNGLPDTQGVYLSSLDGGEPTRVLAAETAAAYAPPGYLLLVSQGLLMAHRFEATRGVVSAAIRCRSRPRRASTVPLIAGPSRCRRRACWRIVAARGPAGSSSGLAAPASRRASSCRRRIRTSPIWNWRPTGDRWRSFATCKATATSG